MHRPSKLALPLGCHYDIREIDEDLYLSVLACRRAKTAGCDSDLAYATDQQQGSVGATKGP
jgi:hypothetical protein